MHTQPAQRSLLRLPRQAEQFRQQIFSSSMPCSDLATLQTSEAIKVGDRVGDRSCQQHLTTLQLLMQSGLI
jgi:hypothetical protein